MNNLKYRFDIWKTYVDRIGEMFMDEKYSISPIFKKDELNFEKFKTIYENDFIKYKTEERFMIPTIGMLNSGKSTLLNSLLQGNYLSISTNIGTKFVCILRHNDNNKIPKFYKCKINQKLIDYKYNTFKYYHFEKEEEIKGNILENIKKINEELKKYENEVSSDKRDINKYFYIMELNIPLFNKNKELGNYFDLLDLPGLNGKDNFYMDKIIPIIIEKSLFSIHIFNIEHFEEDKNKEKYNEYISLFTKKNNSIYILNKIDVIKEEEKNKFKDEDHYNKVFINKLTGKLTLNNNNNEKSFGVDLEKNSFVALSSLNLFNLVNIFSDFKVFISYIIDKNKGKEDDDLFQFSSAIKEQILKNFQIDENEFEEIFNDKKNNYNTYFDKEEFNEISKIIVNKGFQNDLDKKKYKRFNFIFKTKKKKFLAMNELNAINDTIINSMNKSLDEFFDWNKVIELIKSFKITINKIFGKKEEGKKYIELCDNLLIDFRKELEDKSALKKTKLDINSVEILKNIVDSLVELDPENKSLNQLKQNYTSLSYFIYNYRKIRLPLLGGYSTGKSSFLNCIIGKNILPVDLFSCTKIGIIIRHNKKEISQLFRTKFIKIENPEYWYFEDDINPICEGDDQVKQKLLELNNEKVNIENSFIVLKVPLKIFSELNFKDEKLKEDLMEKLELIDFPGLDINNVFLENIFSSLMRFSDGFIFTNNCDLIEEKGNINIIKSIMNGIKISKRSFSYNSCLFLLNKSDKKIDLDINESKEKLENIFFENKLNENNIINLNVNKFSCQLYDKYLKFLDKYKKDFEPFLQYIVDNLFKPEEKIKIKNYKEFLVLINNIIKKLKNHINKKSAKSIEKTKYDKNLINQSLINVFKTLKAGKNINQEKIDSKEDSLPIVDEIYKDYLYIYNNCKCNNQRELSNANSFFESLYDLFYNLYQYTEKQFKKYYELFIENINNLLSLMDLKICGNLFEGQINYDKLEKNYNDLSNETSLIYKEAKNEIKVAKNNTIKNIKNTLKDFFELYCKNSDNNNKFQLDKLEDKINKDIDSYIAYMDIALGKFNNIKKKLNILINREFLNDSLVILNKNSNRFEVFEYENNILINVFKGIANIFISFRNWINEKEVIKKNLDEFEEKIKIALDKYEVSFNENITSIKNDISINIYNNKINITSDFDKIKDKRKQYEQIKEKFYNLIYSKNNA